MARRTISIDEKIKKAKESVQQSKAKYDSAINELEKLMTKKDEMKKEELIAAMMKSHKSFDEIIKFLGNGK